MYYTSKPRILLLELINFAVSWMKIRNVETQWLIKSSDVVQVLVRTWLKLNLRNLMQIWLQSFILHEKRQTKPAIGYASFSDVVISKKSCLNLSLMIVKKL